jgi:hypothetical protein
VRRPVGIAPGQRQVEPAGPDAFDQLGIARHPGLDPDARMGAGEAAQHLGQQRLAEILLQAEPHPAFQLHPLNRRCGLVVEVEQPAGIGQHGLTRLGQGQPPAGLAEDRRARLLLQLAQLGADRRGRTAQPVGRPGVAAELHAQGEAAQHVEVEGHPRHRNHPYFWNCLFRTI